MTPTLENPVILLSKVLKELIAKNDALEKRVRKLEASQ